MRGAGDCSCRKTTKNKENLYNQNIGHKMKMHATWSYPSWTLHLLHFLEWMYWQLEVETLRVTPYISVLVRGIVKNASHDVEIQLQ